MIITNSLGSNYTTKDRISALKLLFQPWKWRDGPETEQLKDTILNIIPGRIASFQIELFLKGRHAIFEALRKLGIGHNDEVIVQAFTCVAVVQPILDLEATPIYIDVDSKNLNPSFEKIKKAVTPKTKAVILQHTLGYINRENDKIVEWCRSHKIFIIQDLAHAIGANTFNEDGPLLQQRTVLSMPDAIILSFSQDKVIDGVSGGALVIPENHVIPAPACISYAESIAGRKAGTYLNRFPIRPGMTMWVIIKLLLYPTITYLIRSTYNYKLGKLIHFCAKNLNLLPSPLEAPAEPTALPNILAALALNQFKRFDKIISHRRNVALTYDRTLNQKFKLVTINDINNSSNLRFPLWVENRDELEKKLTNHSFYLMDHWYDAPVSPGWVDNSEVKYRPGSCPNAEELAKHIFNLPTHINISKKEAERLAKLVNELMG